MENKQCRVLCLYIGWTSKWHVLYTYFVNISLCSVLLFVAVTTARLYICLLRPHRLEISSDDEENEENYTR